MSDENPPSSLLNEMKDWAQHNAGESVCVRIPSEQPAPAEQPAPLKSGESYFRVHLVDVSMSGKSKQWLEQWSPDLHMAVRLRGGDEDEAMFNMVAGLSPSSLEDSAATNSYPLSGLIPYQGGTIELAAALVARRATGKGAVKTIVGDADRYVRLGMHQTFADAGGQSALTPGYLAVILAKPRKLNPKFLFVKDQRLFYSPRPGATPEPLRQHDYMLLRIEGRRERDDWRVESIEQNVGRAMRAMLRGKDAEARRYKTLALSTTLRCPELTEHDQGRLAFAIKEELESLEANRHNAVGDEERDLNQIMAARARPIAQAGNLRRVIQREMHSEASGDDEAFETPSAHNVVGMADDESDPSIVIDGRDLAMSSEDAGALPDDDASSLPGSPVPSTPVPAAVEAREAAAPVAPQHKRINAWLAERAGAVEQPLALNETYTLNFNVGAPVAHSLLTTPSANVAESDIPDEGLDTKWVLTTENVELAQLAADVNVNAEPTVASSGWKAEFKLHVPKSGSSETRQLALTPRNADDAEINIFIFVRNTLYRQFKIELNVAAAAAAPPSSPPEEKKIPLKISSEVIYMPAAHAGLYSPHEWQTPPGMLTLSVEGQHVTVSGETDGGEITTKVNWMANDRQIVGRIKSVRASAETFRSTFSRKLNDIDVQDLEARLAACKADPSRYELNDWAATPHQWADDAHQQAWDNEMASSDELRKLAYDGYMLYNAFFPAAANYPLRDWLDALRPRWRLNIQWFPEGGTDWTSVPWGLLYTQEPPPSPAPIDPSYFWGLRFRLNYLAYAINKPMFSSLGRIDEAKSAYGFYWGNEQEIAEEVTRQQTIWAHLGNEVFVPDKKLSTRHKDQLIDLIIKPGQKPSAVLYFFCHCAVDDGNDPVMRFGNTNDPSDNLRPFDWGASRFTNQPVVFVNACTSVSSDPYLASILVDTFFTQGCRAFLGTEIKVPIRLASRFAEIFYRYFYRTMDDQGLPVAAGEAVFQARRFLWREYCNLGGLFYTYINNFDLYMASKPEVDAMRRHH